jgi:hypothetical protein
MKDCSRFQFVLCPGSMPAKEYEPMYNKIYECWNYVWKDALIELAGSNELHSDLFTRQDYVAAIFDGETCFATSFFRWANSARTEFAQDSYFKYWSSEHLEQLSRRGHNIIVSSQFTVHPHGRGKNLGFSGKDLMMGMVAEIYLNSDADAMTGAARRTRAVNDVCERWGAYPIAKNMHNEYGENIVDLYGFFKDHMLAQSPHILKPMVQDLWGQRMVIPRQEIEPSFRREKILKVA